MQIKRHISAVLSIILCLTLFSSCGKTSGNKAGKKSDSGSSASDVTGSSGSNANQVLKLPYSDKDTLNPFKTATVENQNIAMLLYDSLYKVGSDFAAKPFLASSSSKEKLSITVALKSDALFSDGTRITASDVVYSFKQAQSSTAYSAGLSNFSGASASGNSVIFSMKNPDPYAENVLDFPVVKQGTGTDSESKKGVSTAIPPTGSGRYTFSKSDDDVVLHANSKWSGGETPIIKKIDLVCLPDSTSVQHGIEIGNISFLFQDLNGGSYTRTNSNSADITINNLVFIGINSKNSPLDNAAVRQAISSAIDRSNIATNAYQGHAAVAKNPFNPDWNAAKSYSVFKIDSDVATAANSLQSAGFKQSGISNSLTKNGSSVTLKLIVNSENPFRVNAADMVKTQLTAVGFKVQEEKLSFEDYEHEIKKKNYDLYIGEVKLPYNMSLSEFFTSGGALSSGIDTSGKTAQAYSQLLQGSATIGSFIDAFNSDMPFIPICYRKGVVSYTRELKGNINSYAGDLYSNINEWKF